jgi:hypothetical protein
MRQKATGERDELEWRHAGSRPVDSVDIFRGEGDLVLLGLAAINFLQELSIWVVGVSHCAVLGYTSLFQSFPLSSVEVEAMAEKLQVTYWTKSPSSLEEALMGGPAAVLGFSPPDMAAQEPAKMEPRTAMESYGAQKKKPG